VNRLGVKPRGFPWVSRTLSSDHRSDRRPITENC